MNSYAYVGEEELKIASSKKYWVLVPIVLVTITSLFIYFMPVAAPVKRVLGEDFFLFLLVGFFAQLVDGTLGMAYGATTTSCLLGIGVPPAVSSASVHIAEMFTTGASAISHYSFGNINKKLFRYLLIPGVLGALVGAYLLGAIIDGDAIKPYISIYMIILGLVIIKKAFTKIRRKQKVENLGILACFGGFMDAIGGGGWGPIVTSTLLSKGKTPRYTIGSVNAAEFAVTTASGCVLFFNKGIESWQIILGLIMGGIIASPIGAVLVHKIKRRPFMIFIGALIIFLSVKNLIHFFSF